MRSGLLILASLAASLSAPLSSAASGAAARPVMVAGHEDLDACLSTAFVRELKPGAYLSVRTGPSVKAKEIARLRSGHVVWDCDGVDGWVGIVFHPQHRTQDDIDCDLGPSETPRRPYRGNCLSGWVRGSYLLNLAG